MSNPNNTKSATFYDIYTFLIMNLIVIQRKLENKGVKSPRLKLKYALLENWIFENFRGSF